MKIIDKKQINKNDLKLFAKWASENFFLFNNKNFYTKLITINKNIEYEENLIEFFLFNKFELNDRYSLEWPIWLKSVRGSDMKKWLRSLFHMFFSDKEKEFDVLFDFLLDLIKYKKRNKKEIEKEYQLALKYNEFIISLRKTEDINYNEWIIFLNKNIYKELKGYIKV